MFKKQKADIFLDLVAKINKKFEINPILFGSLGLSMVTGYAEKINDIDILVQTEFVKDRWNELIRFMEENRFRLKDEKEHEFEKNNTIINFGDEDDLKRVGIDKNNLKITKKGDATFKELLPEQYLIVYKEMLRDNYRQEKLEKNDKEKIVFIEKFLKKNSTNEQENLDGWKRCQADFDNYRKRQDERMKELGILVKEDMALQIFPVLDNFQASIEHIPEDQQKSAWVEGMLHIQRQMEDVLKNNGIEEIEAKIGDEFNPEIHEAVENHQEKEKEEKHKIKKIISKGYKIGDKIIRAARVIVE